MALRTGCLNLCETTHLVNVLAGAYLHSISLGPLVGTLQRPPVGRGVGIGACIVGRIFDVEALEKPSGRVTGNQHASRTTGSIRVF